MSNCGSQTAKILTVGQAHHHLKALSECLRSSRWCIRAADGVRSGIELLTRGDTDVIISDMHLPDGSWSDLLEGFRPQSDCPPIVVSSEDIDARMWAKALSRGAYDILVKPFNVEEVLYVVRNAWLNRLHRAPTAFPFPQPSLR